MTELVAHVKLTGLKQCRSCPPFTPHRQRELKRCTCWHIPRRPQPAAVALNDQTADREPHPEPVGLRRVEGVEQPVEVLRSEPRTRIAYGNQHHFRRLPSGGLHPPLSRPPPPPRH